MKSFYLDKKQFLSQEVSQKMLLSPGMCQSLKVLQMPFTELSSWIEEQIEQNPLLEWNPSFSQPIPIKCPEEPIYTPSFFEHLMQQASLVFVRPELLSLAEWILGNLDDTGFYSLPPESIPFSFSKKDLAFCLETIQNFDPPGIASCNLQEYLLLQLENAQKENTLSYLLIRNHFEELLNKTWGPIQKKLNKTFPFLLETLKKEIGHLSLSPLDSFQNTPIHPLIADVFLEEEDWHVEIKQPNLPFCVSYEEQESFTPEDRLFFKNRQMEAKWLFEAIEKRTTTLKKVSEYLIKKQIRYLKRESDTLVSLSIQEISQDLSLHESTILRAIANKNLSCSLGVFPLKKLLSRNLCKDLSCDQTQKLLQKLIAEEDKTAPLSDRELLEKMQTKHGFCCSRRTLTKYRKDLKIPSKGKRKKN